MLGLSERTNSATGTAASQHFSIIVFGASGDLAKKKTFPAIWQLFKLRLLSTTSVTIVGYARTEMTSEEFITRVLASDADQELRQITHYMAGTYEDLSILSKQVASFEKQSKHITRVFYLALPPTIFLIVAQGIKKWLCTTSHGNISVRIVIEKPFGSDLASSNELSFHLRALFEEEQIYRIDHYLGKEMVKSLVILRFANSFFQAVWRSSAIDNVQITFKETIGIEGRGGYFDTNGIVRDIFQNHLLQLLSLIAMETPKSLHAEHIRDEKVKVLQCVEPIHIDLDAVLGQYSGYKKESNIDPLSRTPTFATVILHINNERWRGVPFILKCGKGLNEQKAEVRIQFKDVFNINLFDQKELARNELVIKIQPNEAVYLKLMVKEPGLEFRSVISELDLSLREKFAQSRIPEAYESLILDVLLGERANFVRADELEVAWKIATPLLNPHPGIKIHEYAFGSRGPPEADSLAINAGGYLKSEKPYAWKMS